MLLFGQEAGSTGRRGHKVWLLACPEHCDPAAFASLARN